MARVLILTTGYGEGHNAAARALAEGIRSLGGEAEVRDVLLETYGRMQEIGRMLYLDCIDRAPLLWAAAYRLLEFRPLSWALMRLQWPAAARLRAIVEESKPDAIVSVYPAYGHMLDRIYPKHRTFTEYTVITDSISIHPVWYSGGTSAYIVANGATEKVVRAKQPNKPVEPLGFPVRTEFCDHRPDRKPPGDGEPLRVLFMATHAKDGIIPLIRDLLEIPHLHLTVTIGRDEALGRRLSAAAVAMNRKLEVLGWVKNMPQLQMSHHVLIGKAGGAATQETLAAHTPMLITQIVPGQEEGNAQLVLENECGALTKTAAEIRETLQELAADNFARWKHWAVQTAIVGRPDSARTVARRILNP